MNHPSSTRALFLAGMLFASGAFAGNDINKCVSPGGDVTLTDEACPEGARTVKIISGPAKDNDTAVAVEPGARPSVQRDTVARMPARYATLLRSPKPAGGLPLDVSTLKAARMNMLIFDNAAEALKARSLAGL